MDLISSHVYIDAPEPVSSVMPALLIFLADWMIKREMLAAPICSIITIPGNIIAHPVYKKAGIELMASERW